MAIRARLLEALVRAPPWLAGKPVVLDGQRLDTQTQVLLRLQALTELTPLHELSPAQLRSRFKLVARLRPPRPAGVATEEMRARTVPVRVYRPAGAGPLPAVVFFHGGGWVIGDLETQDLLCARIADEASCVVVSADYRLAPEHPFPAAVEDALTVFRWTVDGAARLGVDRRRIAVAGSSAGGCLAAVVAREIEGACFQLLLCPATDISKEAPSYQLFADGFGLTAAEMRWFIDHYTPDPAARLDPRASPLLAPDLAGLASACVVVAGFDPLRDEGLAYAERLRTAGVSVEVVLEPSAIHGFVGLAGLLDVSEHALERACDALRRAFSTR